jgi:predicted nucleic acid-binding protein
MRFGEYVMPDTLQLYWDSCVFLSYVDGVPNRLPDIDELLKQAERGTVEIVTSAISIVEVAFGEAERQQRALDPQLERKISTLWVPPSPVKLVEFYALIADEAKDLMRDAMTRGWSLKGMDAIHLATARRLDVSEVHTYDDKLLKYGEVLGVRVGPPLASQLALPVADS